MSSCNNFSALARAKSLDQSAETSEGNTVPELAAAVPASATPPRAMDSLAVLVLPAKLVRATSDNPKSIPCPASKYPMPYLLAS